MTPRRTAIVCAFALLAAVWWLARNDDAVPARAADPAVVEVTEALASVELAPRSTREGAPRDVAPLVGGEGALRSSDSLERDAAPRDANTPPALVLRGRATFRNGGPVPKIGLIAVAVGAPRGRPIRHDPAVVFGEASTAQDGSFALQVNAHAVAAGAFQIRTATPVPWADDDRVHAVDPERLVELVYAGAMVTIVAVDALGEPVARATMNVAFAGVHGFRRAISDERGRAVLPYHGTPTMTVRGVANDARLAAGPLDFDLDDRIAEFEALVEFAPGGFDAELYVEVVDTKGAPLEHFGVYVRDEWHLAYRYALSEDLGPNGLLIGLREGPAFVRPSIRGRAPPTLYDGHKQPEIAIDLSSERATSIRVVVDAETGGVALDVERAADGPPFFRIFVRSSGEHAWKRVTDIWTYQETTAVSSVQVEGSGPHWFGRMPPGPLELSVRAPDDSELERVTLEIRVGRYTPLVLRR